MDYSDPSVPPPENGNGVHQQHYYPHHHEVEAQPPPPPPVAAKAVHPPPEDLVEMDQDEPEVSPEPVEEEEASPEAVEEVRRSPTPEERKRSPSPADEEEAVKSPPSPVVEKRARSESPELFEPPPPPTDDEEPMPAEPASEDPPPMPNDDSPKKDAAAAADFVFVDDYESEDEVIDGVTQLSDEDYFDGEVCKEELEWYKELGPAEETVQKAIPKCTACCKQMNLRGGNLATRHPRLGVAICQRCKDFYASGEWTRDEEGCDQFCRWCAQGGELLVCDKCPHAFCKRCLQRNLGRSYVTEANDAEEWACIMCEPKQIYKFRAEYHAMSKVLTEERKKQKEAARKKRENAARKAAGLDARGPAKAAEKQVDAEACNKFVEESFQAALDSLRVVRDFVEGERDRWDAGDKSSATQHTVAEWCRSLRHAADAARHNAELIDHSVVSGYGELFTSKGAKEKIKVNKVSNSSNLVPEALKSVKLPPPPKKPAAASSPKKAATPAKKKPAPKPAKKKAAPAKKVVAKKSKPKPASRKEVSNT